MGLRSYTKGAARTHASQQVQSFPTLPSRVYADALEEEKRKREEKNKKDQIKWEKKHFPDKVVRRIRALIGTAGMNPTNIAYLVSLPTSVVEKILTKEIRGDLDE